MKVRFKRTIIYEDGEFKQGEIYDVEKKIADRFAEYIEVVKIETDTDKVVKIETDTDKVKKTDEGKEKVEK